MVGIQILMAIVSTTWLIRNDREHKVSPYVGLGPRRRFHETRQGGNAGDNKYAHRIHNEDENEIQCS